MSFAQDAGLFVHQLDLANDRVLLVQMTENDFAEASFLDNRLLQANPGQQQRAMQWGQWDVIASQTPGTRDDAQFIFHIGHVGSTLISRLLGATEQTLSIREPQLLRQFAELKALRGLPHSPWSPDRFDERLGIVLQWLSRTFRPNQRALIKATSFVSDLAPEVLQTGRKAVFLTLSPERYIQTILAGENSRQELSALSSTRLQRLHGRLGAEPFKLWQLDEAERAAMAWACEMTALEIASTDAVLWIDFDDFLKAPADRLAQIALHLGINLPIEQAQQLVSGPIMQQYSKAPEHGYSPALREEVLAGAARDRATDITKALSWLDNAGKAHTLIGQALSRSGRK